MQRRRDAEPLSAAELIALRKLLRKPVVEAVMTPAEAARALGFKNKRTVLNLVRQTDELPNAFKPRPNVVAIPVGDVLAYREKRRVRACALEGEAP